MSRGAAPGGNAAKGESTTGGFHPYGKNHAAAACVFSARAAKS